MAEQTAERDHVTRMAEFEMHAIEMCPRIQIATPGQQELTTAV